jgi:hypothetical protein
VQPSTWVAGQVFVGVVADRDDKVIVLEDVADVGGRRRLQGRAVAAADPYGPGCTRGAGSVPADVAGIGLRRAQRAAASWERAELWVQTNTTRGACVSAAGTSVVSASGRSRRCGAGHLPTGLGGLRPCGQSSIDW